MDPQYSGSTDGVTLQATNVQSPDWQEADVRQCRLARLVHMLRLMCHSQQEDEILDATLDM